MVANDPVLDRYIHCHLHGVEPAWRVDLPVYDIELGGVRSLLRILVIPPAWGGDCPFFVEVVRPELGQDIHSGPSATDLGTCRCIPRVLCAALNREPLHGPIKQRAASLALRPQLP